MYLTVNNSKYLQYQHRISHKYVENVEKTISFLKNTMNVDWDLGLPAARYLTQKLSASSAKKDFCYFQYSVINENVFLLLLLASVRLRIVWNMMLKNPILNEYSVNNANRTSLLMKISNVLLCLSQRQRKRILFSHQQEIAKEMMRNCLLRKQLWFSW